MIPKEILDYGVGLDLIKKVYNLTKLKGHDFNEVEFIRFNKKSILIRINLIIRTQNGNRHRKMVLEITKEKIRSFKLNDLINED